MSIDADPQQQKAAPPLMLVVRSSLPRACSDPDFGRARSQSLDVLSGGRGFGLMIATTTAINFLPYSLFLPEWSANAAIAIYGVLLYVLLLWEFNGPLGRAVAKQLSTGKSDAPTV